MQWFSNIPTHMDYKGQYNAEQWSQGIILAFVLIGTLWAYISQLFSMAIICHAIGVTLACLLCLPPWPIYRRNPLKWQPAVKRHQPQSKGSVEANSKQDFMSYLKFWWSAIGCGMFSLVSLWIVIEIPSKNTIKNKKFLVCFDAFYIYRHQLKFLVRDGIIGAVDGA